MMRDHNHVFLVATPSKQGTRSRYIHMCAQTPIITASSTGPPFLGIYLHGSVFFGLSSFLPAEDPEQRMFKCKSRQVDGPIRREHSQYKSPTNNISVITWFLFLVLARTVQLFLFARLFLSSFLACYSLGHLIMVPHRRGSA